MISADGKKSTPITPEVDGQLPVNKATLNR